MMQVLIGQTDTLEHLALQYLGSSDYASFLAQANQLDYPFIVQDPFYVSSASASGNVTITAQGVTLPYTISAGDVVAFYSVAPSIAAYQTGGATVSYAALNSVTLTAQTLSTTLAIQATQPGGIGNILPNKIQSAISGLQVQNPSPITGGFQANVLKPGDFITIPIQNMPSSPTALSLEQKDALGGSDLKLTATNGLEFLTDDLVVTTGLPTIAGDIAANISTPYRSIADNPHFGTLVPITLGKGGNYTEQRIAVMVQGAAKADSRVQSVTPVSITVSGTFALIEIGVVVGSETIPVITSVGGVNSVA